MGFATDDDDQCLDARHVVDAYWLMSSNNLFICPISYTSACPNTPQFSFFFDRVL